VPLAWASRPGYSVCVSRILIRGASGLIGSTLVRELESRGGTVTRVVRRLPEKENEVQWDPMREIPPESVSGFDAAIHLSGETVAGRWTAAKKRRIRESRVVTTQNLTQALMRAQNPPRTFLCASAVGYYGDRGDEILTEASAAGEGFLADLCREWEAASEPAAQSGIGVANLRFGIVLSREGGALKQVLLPFRSGLGGKIGSGQQWWSWIHIEDAVRAILHVLGHPENALGHIENEVVGNRAARPDRSEGSPGLPRGSVNIVSPNPVTNAKFTRALAGALKRPAFFTVPAAATKLALGEFAQAGLLASARVLPKKLLESGFEFRFPELSAALSNLLT
jgi:uncharacterized protein